MVPERVAGWDGFSFLEPVPDFRHNSVEHFDTNSPGMVDMLGRFKWIEPEILFTVKKV